MDRRKLVGHHAMIAIDDLDPGILHERIPVFFGNILQLFCIPVKHQLQIFGGIQLTFLFGKSKKSTFPGHAGKLIPRKKEFAKGTSPRGSRIPSDHLTLTEVLRLSSRLLPDRSDRCYMYRTG